MDLVFASVTITRAEVCFTSDLKQVFMTTKRYESRSTCFINTVKFRKRFSY